MSPHEIIGALAQLLLALAVFGNMVISWKNNKKITAVHDTTDRAAQKAEVAVGDASAQLQNAKEEVLVAIKNGNGHK